MKRRSNKLTRKPPADLLAGWQTDLFRPPAKRLFPVAELSADCATTAVPPQAVVEPQRPTRYTVHCYVTVCVKLTGIVAVSPREAAHLAQQRFDWEQHGRGVVFVDELHEMLVDVEGDEDYSRSVAFRADLEPVP